MADTRSITAPRWLCRWAAVGAAALCLHACSGDSPPGTGRAPTQTAVGMDSVELLALERVWNEGHLKGDAQALDGLWADDMIVIVPRMQIMTRTEAIEMARSGRMRFERYETTDLRARVYKDAGVVTGRLVRTRVMNGRNMADDWQFTKVYMRISGRWKVVSFHASESPG